MVSTQEMSKIPRFNGLQYSVTNEVIEGIVAGLDVSGSDVVVAIAASGDALFALCEFTDKITGVDHKEIQLKFIAWRKKLLQSNDPQSFVDIPSLGLLDPNIGHRDFPESSERRRTYFSSRTRISKIALSAENIKLVHSDILKYLSKDHKATRIYMSNTVSSLIRNKPRFLNTAETLDAVTEKLSLGGLIYVTDHHELLYHYYDERGWPGTLGRDVELDDRHLPRSLEIVKDLTKMAQLFNEPTEWVPAVYRKRS